MTRQDSCWVRRVYTRDPTDDNVGFVYEKLKALQEDDVLHGKPWQVVLIKKATHGFRAAGIANDEGILPSEAGPFVCLPKVSLLILIANSCQPDMVRQGEIKQG